MSKILKQEILSILYSLLEAQDVLTELLYCDQREEFIGLLADCQDGAIAIGNKIEAVYGEGTESVHILEEYCETLYNITEKQGNIAQCNKECALAGALLTEAKKYIEKEIPDKLEIVFLPYKASMWDSLESIYLVAKEDSGCDVYCVPIPYYDLNEDHSFGEFHDEQNEYPSNIEVTDWRSYQIEDRKPDIIFIHNPYDDWNLVTSVEPRFYSKKLRNYTNMLVYIPYFILDEIELDNAPAIENMKHFCFLPGTVYADRVVVQSENLKKIYVDEYIKAAKEQGIQVERAYAEEKFQGVGSPKLDKVKSIRKENLEIPEEWMRVIRKPDGSWKKVILYNTSINSFLAHGARMLRKIKDVFEVFKMQQEDIALLWRPHPLLENTLKSMRREIVEEYCSIVKKYKEDGWGIYDDTADMNRSVTLSDAYYGDYSSMMWLYREVGKPVMVQEPDCMSEDGYSLAMDNIVDYQGEWWFLAMQDNGIYRMDKDTLKVTFVKRIPVKRNGFPQYGKIYMHHNKIFVLPWSADHIVVYDMDHEELRYIKFKNEDTSRGMAFLEGIKKEKNLYLVPYGSDCIVNIDMDTEEIDEIPVPKVSDKPRMYAWGSVFVEGNCIFFTKLFENKIISLNIETKDLETYECPYIEEGSGICGNENFVFLIPRKTDKVLCWDKRNKKMFIYKDFPERYDAGETWSFHKIWLDGDLLYLLPREANMCITVSGPNGEMREVLEGKTDKDIDNWYDKYMYYCNIWKDRDSIKIMSSKRGVIYSIDKNGEITEGYVEDCNGPKEVELNDIVYEHCNKIDNLECYAKSILGFNSEWKIEMGGIGANLFQVIRKQYDRSML